MLPVLPGDVAALARAVYRLPASERAREIDGVLEAADIADLHRRRTGRAHPRWGTGSLMAAVSDRRKIDEPDFDDDRYCLCWIEVLTALRAHRAAGRGDHPEAQETQSGRVGSRSSRPSGISSPQSRHSP